MASNTAHPPANKGKGKATTTQQTGTRASGSQGANSRTQTGNRGAQTANTTESITEKPEGDGKSGGIHWEPDPTRTEKLLSWLLSHPADRIVLFYDKKDPSPSLSPAAADNKASGTRKKYVHAVIAEHVFKSDAVYGPTFTKQPDKFTIAVANRLATLKKHYRNALDKMKATGAGINPDDPRYKNLREKTLATCPYFDKCHAMWAGNPSYNTSPHNGAPGLSWTEDFLSIIKRAGGGSKALPAPSPLQGGVPEAEGALQEVVADGVDEGGGVGAPGDGGEDDAPKEYPEMEIDPETGELIPPDFGMYEEELPPDEDTDMLQDEEDGDQLGDQEMVELSSPPSWSLTPRNLKPAYPIKPRTSSWDGRSAFRNASHPYFPCPPTSTISSSATSLSALSSSSVSNKRRQATPSRSSQTSSTKGKNSLVQMGADLKEKLSAFSGDTKDAKLSSAMLKTERYSMKMNVLLREKEISFLEQQQRRDAEEAEVIHRRQQEVKQSEIALRHMDAEVFEKEAEMLRLKIHLAELSAASAAGGAGPSGSQI
ncbi:hypothetical protein HYDPIDRAFT_26543 [Hydnomerulius pinastri MD-312]|nr:hypothetical protein HYDPIDRAFT_26540 [Hydnomerulius pinastri MD-312]KIJ67144.1 hypothetical protein HYDPIDRAFT_26543 [Hydnomerulius pinastri MD-312]